MLVDLPHIRRVCRSLVPERARGDVMVVSRRLSAAIGGYFRGQLAVAFVVGTMSSIGMLIIDLPFRSEEHTSELQSLMRNSYAVFCLKKKNRNKQYTNTKFNI